MYYIDAKGLVCPKPVIMAKKALKEHNEISIDVDNEMSSENLQKMAKVMGLTCEVSQDGDVFHLEMAGPMDGGVVSGAASGVAAGITAADGLAGAAAGNPAVASGLTGAATGGPAANGLAGASAPADDYIVVISSQFAGTGNDELGAALMKSFIYTLTEADVLPTCILFYNGGVRLTTNGSAVLEDLDHLAAAGVDILSCGTCLNYYGLTEQLAVGQVTNMYEIFERQKNAGKIVRI